MPGNLRSAIANWHEADRKAREIESELSDKLRAYEQHKGPPVSRELVDAAVRRRRDAHEKLRIAVASMAGGPSRDRG